MLTRTGFDAITKEAKEVLTVDQKILITDNNGNKEEIELIDKKKVLRALKNAKKKCPLRGLNLPVLDWYEQYIINKLKLE